MTKLEVRYPCPVCLGVKLEKLKPVKSKDLVLDYCRRCGGIWFDAGEVRALREVQPKGSKVGVALRNTAFKMPCHFCHTPMDRNAPKCLSCGWKNEIECPTCQKILERVEQGELVLDVCHKCKGVWFDNHELAKIWNLKMRTDLARSKKDGGVVEADFFMLDAFLWAPDLLFYTAHGAAHVGGSVVEGIAHVAAGGVDVIGGAADAAGAVAEGAGAVFEVIAEIIGGLFG